jgi:monoamine oxidase
MFQDPEEIEALALLNDWYTAVEMTAAEIDVTVFDDFPEDVSFEEWTLRNESWDHPMIAANAAQLTTSIVGREPKDVGAHYWFDYIKSGRGLTDSLLSDTTDGAQYLMVKTGTTSICTSIKDVLPDSSVMMNSPVTKIQDGTTLTTSSGKLIKAKKTILAIMPSTYSKIDFAPSLPESKQGLISASQEGLYAKVLVTYAAPWWREFNLTGQFFSFTGPITYSLETSVPSLEQYSLACFISGDFAVDWFELSHEEKLKAVVAHLAEMVAEIDEELVAYAEDTLEINYADWTNEEYIGGGPTNVMGPGMLRKYGETLRESVGDMHFAGTETAYEWKGYLEGAVAAGYRAAEEVIEALKQ